MMSKKSGISTQNFYGSQNSSFRRKNIDFISDENEMPEKKRQNNTFNKTNGMTYESPLSITSRTSPNEHEMIYRSKNNFPINSCLTDTEISRVNNGFNSKNSFKTKQISKKQTRGGNQQNSRYSFKPLDISYESPPNNRQHSKGIKISLKTPLSKSPVSTRRPNSSLYNDENDENSPKSVKSSSQTEILDYFKPNSSIVSNGFETPPKRVSFQINGYKEKKVSPLLSSSNNSLNNFQTSKSSKHLKKDLTLPEEYENQNIMDSNNINTYSFSTDSVSNDEQIPALIESENFGFSDCVEVLQVLDPNNPIGLRNLGNTCYMNSIVQAIFALKFFIEDLKNKFSELTKISEQSHDFSMTRSLLNLYHQYNGLRNKAEDCSVDEVENHLSILKECVGKKWSSFKSHTQQDAAEFFGHIIDTIKEEFESVKDFPQINNPIARNFEFETGGSLTCKKCKNKTKLDNEKQHALYLSLPEDKSLQTAFLNSLKDETTSHKCVAANCGTNENILNKYYTKLSKVLFLQLGRYSVDGSKRNEEVFVPQNIYLPVKPNNSDNAINLITPSPLATPYRSKLQDVFTSDKISSVVRKMSFENLDNCENIRTLDVLESKLSDMESEENNQNGIELDLNTNITISEETNDSSKQESNTSASNKFNVTPNKQFSKVSLLSNDSMPKENGEKSLVKRVFQTNNLLNDRNNKENTENANNYEKYQLVAVICHHGSSLSGGHYSSYVYNIETSEWFQCDDNDISRTDFDSVQKSSKTLGYCYFYVHK